MGIDTWAVDFVLLDEMMNVSGMQWRTGTDGRKVWTGKYMSLYRKTIYTEELEYRNRFSIRSIS